MPVGTQNKEDKYLFCTRNIDRERVCPYHSPSFFTDNPAIPR